MTSPAMHKMAYPIETPEAFKFWASRHICNRLKAIICFSKDEEDAKRNLRRFGYPYHFRARAWNAYQNLVKNPDMTKIEFTPMGIPWWDCMPTAPLPPPKGRWILWNDRDLWEETTPDPWDNKWIEWVDDDGSFPGQGQP
ncbi:MAG: hypothetical protein ACRDC4_00570 [Plesiomonas sp.]